MTTAAQSDPKPAPDPTGRWAIVMVTCILLTMLGLIGRVVQLKVKPDPRLPRAAEASISSRTEFTRRGRLLDRQGRVIATTTLGRRLFIDPQTVDDVTTIATDLARLIDGDPVAIDRALHKRLDSRYVVIDHLLEPSRADAVADANLRGVGLEPVPVRVYPYDDIAASIVGMVGFEHTGLSGFEYLFNKPMQPEPGSIRYLRDVRRRALWFDPDAFEPGSDGVDIRLSLDMVIQEYVERRIQQAVIDQNAGGARAVVADVQTGEILAIADVLNPREGWEEQTEDPNRDKDPRLGRNRCVTDPYEPGSTFKPFVWSVATELGKASPDEILPTPAGVPHRTSKGRRIRDTFYYANSSWLKVLLKSQNSGMAIVAERMSNAQMQDAVDRFGFGDETYCGLPGESAGMVTTPKNWTHYTQTSVCMGQEIAVTPVQMVRAFSVFARDGTLPTLRITASSYRDGQVRIQHQVLRQETVDTVRDALRQVMTDGSGRKSQSAKYQLFGKSGTPQLPKREGGGYHEDRYVSNFIAGGPFTDPRLVCLVIIDDPDKNFNGHYGGEIAGPVVRDILDVALDYLGVMPDQPDYTEVVASAD